MELEPIKPNNSNLKLGLILTGTGVAIFCMTFFYFNIVMAIMKFIFYFFVAVTIGGAIHEFGEAINKNRTARKIKSGIWYTIKKILFPIALFGMTARYYYVMFAEGIDSFYRSVAGIIIAIALAVICILYFLFFIRKSKTKIPIGK